MRLKNPDLKKKVLLSKITKQLKDNPKSFKSFIKTYSTFVLKKRRNKSTNKSIMEVIKL